MGVVFKSYMLVIFYILLVNGSFMYLTKTYTINLRDKIVCFTFWYLNIPNLPRNETMQTKMAASNKMEKRMIIPPHPPSLDIMQYHVMFLCETTNVLISGRAETFCHLFDHLLCLQTMLLALLYLLFTVPMMLRP